MAHIVLTNGAKCLVDEGDMELVTRYNWYTDTDGYARRMMYLGKVNGKPKYKSLFLHRYILDAPKGMSVDHINGDILDNRRGNLRLCSHSQNLSNQKLSKANTSGYKGVSWHSQNQRWSVKLCAKGKSISLGCYDDIKEAALAYNTGAIKHFGEYARLNEVY